jgi:two-component system nitrogen regulation response regulator GlnG
MHPHSDATAAQTMDGSRVVGRANVAPALTIVWHPDVSRIGEICPLSLAPGQSVSVVRLEPAFSRAGEPGPQRPLEHNRLSRSTPALQILTNERGQLELRPGGGEATAEVYGAPLERATAIRPAELESGVIITLARRIVLCLHRVQLPITRGPQMGLIGGGDGMENVRRMIRRVAGLEVPVLIRGETGTGKEMVARALVEGSPRAGKPLISVNMAAVSPTTAVAELFGHERGAFTGASVARSGYFGQAAGGTLFLDEVGLASRELQPMLLRALESGEIHSVGAARGQRVDVRVMAATDSDLESEIAARSFSEPLFQRLAGFQILLPPLRQRREDIGSLLLHFLERELAAVGARNLLAEEGEGGKPWLSAPEVARLAMASWPGNVRALRNAVRQMVIASHTEPRAVIDGGVERLMDPTAQESAADPWSSAPNLITNPQPHVHAAPARPAPAEPSEVARTSRDIDMETFYEAYRRNGWSASATAAELGIPRTTVIALRDRHPNLRNPNKIPPAELRQALRECNGDITLLAERLQVSRRGLQLRLSQLSQDGTPTDRS